MASRPNLINTSESSQGWSTVALPMLFVILQVVNLPLIIFYYPAHYLRDHNDHSSIVKPFFHHDSRIPDFISDTSPAAFMLACVVYAFAAGSFYRLNVKDRYQSRFLASGIAAAILMSSPHPMVSLPHPVIFKSWLPVMITLTLLLSTVFHQRNPEWRTRSAEASEDTDEKHSNLQI